VSAAIPDTIYREEWELYWPTAAEQNLTAVGGQIQNLVLAEAAWLTAASALLRILESSLRNSREAVEPEVPISKELYAVVGELPGQRRLIQRHERDSDRKVRLLNAIHRVEEAVSSRTDTAHDDVALVVGEMDKLVWEAHSLLDQVRLMTSSTGRLRRISRFPHALHVSWELNGRDDRAVASDLERLFESHRIRARKHRAGERITHLNLLPKLRNGGNRERWICASGPMARRSLLALAVDLYERLPVSAKLRCMALLHLPREEQLMLAPATSSYDNRAFWKRAKGVLGKCRRGSCRLAVAVPNSNTSAIRGARSELNRLVKNKKLTQLGEKTATVGSLLPMSWNLASYGTQEDSDPHETGGESDRVHLGVLTVLPEETRAVSDVLQQEPGYEEREGTLIQRLFYRGELPREDGTRVSVACVQALEQGSRSMMSAYRDLIDEHAPQVVALVGIGGSIRSDIGLCDVAIGSQVVYYDKRKEEETGTRRRGEAYRMTADMLERVNRFFVASGVEPAEFPASTGSPRDKFRVHLGPIGSGEAVVRFREAEERVWLEKYNDKVTVLETEAGGAAHAFYEEALRKGPQPNAFLVIRGVSDHANHDHDDALKLPAATNAMLTLGSLVEYIFPVNDGSLRGSD